MNERYSIGELSEKTGLTVHTIRYYDSIGLLKPDYIDEQTGYRYYYSSAFWNAEVIKMFRNLDIPLDNLKKVVTEMNNDSIKTVLNDKRQEAKDAIKKYRQIIKNIDWLEESLEEMEESQARKIVEVEREPYYVIYMENYRKEKEIHLTLQDISLNEMNHIETIKRKYGYVLDPSIIENDIFYRKGEFVNLYKSRYKFTDKEYIYTIPGGTYVCQTLPVTDSVVDLSGVRKYLSENGLKSKMVFAEEVGMPLFNFKNFDCEIQILVEKL